MSDICNTMTQKEMLGNLYEASISRAESDAQLKAQMGQVMQRLDKSEKVMEKICETLSEQKVIEHSIGELNEGMSHVSRKIGDIHRRIDSFVEWKNEQEKKQALENKDTEILEMKMKSISDWKDQAEERLDNLENKNAQTVFALVKKIGMIALGVLVTGGVGYFIGKF